jgi:hypothetical protein
MGRRSKLNILLADIKGSEEEFFRGMDKNGYVWCLHCEQVSKKEDFINNAIEKDWAGCLVDGCDGAGWGMDIFPWLPDEWPRSCHPEYPDVPVIGVEYPLH